jgi:hypothetical protein
MKQEFPIHPLSKGFGWKPMTAFIAGLLVYAVLLSRFIGAYGGPADCSGYLGNAMLMGQGLTRADQRVVPGVHFEKLQQDTFVPYGFRNVAGQKMAAMYPIGLSLSVALTAKILGWQAAPHATIVAFALLGLLLTAALAREWGLPWSWAWFAALLLAVCPLYIHYSLHLMSDMPSLVCVTLAVLLAWKSRGQLPYAAAAGMAVAVAVLTRPNNVIAMLPVAACMGLVWRRWLLLGLGGLPGAILFLFYNHSAYGHALEMGYGSIAKNLFGWNALPASLLHYATWIPWLLPLALPALAMPWMRGNASPRWKWVFIAWVFAYFGFFAFDKDTSSTWWMLRYVMPAFPALIVAGLSILHHYWEKTNRKAVRIGCSLLLLAIVRQGLVMEHQLGVWGMGGFCYTFFTAATWWKAQVPDNAVIVCTCETSGALYCYTPYTIVRWDQIADNKQWHEIVNACSKSKRPVYAMIFSANPNEAPGSKLAGNWMPIGRLPTFTFWRFEGLPPSATE